VIELKELGGWQKAAFAVACEDANGRVEIGKKKPAGSGQKGAIK